MTSATTLSGYQPDQLPKLKRRKLTINKGATYLVEEVVSGPLGGCIHCQGGIITMKNVANEASAKLCRSLEGKWRLVPNRGPDEQCSEVDPANIEVAGFTQSD